MYVIGFLNVVSKQDFVKYLSLGRCDKDETMRGVDSRSGFLVMGLILLTARSWMAHQRGR